jgi:GNAT superfamily N-acetyltransferase
MGELTFVDVTADDADAIRRWYDVVRTVNSTDRPDDVLPGFRAWQGHLTDPNPGTEPHLLLAEVDGVAVGWLGIWLPTVENLDVAPGELEVHPDHRKRGYGHALVDEWERRAKGFGRTRLLAEAAVGPHSAFAESLGFTSKLVDTQRRLDLADLDEERVEELYADALAHSGGYSLRRFVGRTPEDLEQDVAALESRMTTDAPLDDLVWEQEVIDVDRLREHERVVEDRGTRRYTTVAVEDATGTVVGLSTLVVFDGADPAGYQWATIVDPPHRGHRLGMLLKVANLRHLREHEPQVRHVDTWNADSNAPMLRVNVAMGFQPVRQWAEYERTL